MRIFALDCATKTGWALIDNGKIVESGMQNFSKRRGESNGVMFLRFNKWVSDMVDMLKPELLTYERAHYRGGAATEIGVGLQTRVQEMAIAKGIDSIPFTTAEIKKFATGKGNAGKDDMIIAAVPFLGRQPIDDNEADAVHLARLADREV